MWQKIQLIVIVALVAYVIYQHRILQRSVMALERTQRAMIEQIAAPCVKPSVQCPVQVVVKPTQPLQIEPTPDVVADADMDLQPPPSNLVATEDVIRFDASLDPIQTFSSPSSEATGDHVIKAIVKDAFDIETLSTMNQKALRELAKSKGVAIMEGKRPRTKLEISKDIIASSFLAGETLAHANASKSESSPNGG